MTEKCKKLWAEYKFRQQAIWRLYPGARIRVGRGGGSWDTGQPSVVHVVLDDTADGVIYDHEMSRLMQAIDREMADYLAEALAKNPPDPESLPMKMRDMGIAFAAMATSDQTWTEGVQGFWKKARGE